MSGTTRIVLAALAGGAVMFAWGAFSHMVLPLGEAGIGILPEEDALIEAMRGSIAEPGFYFFPGQGAHEDPSSGAWKAWHERYRRGPRGILVYEPAGAEPLSARQMLTELASNVLAALFGAIVLSRITAGYGARVLLAGLFGLIGWMSISVSQWNWYAFPAAITLVEGFDQLAGWLLSGLVLATIVRPRGA